MAWTVPQHRRGAVDGAGQRLAEVGLDHCDAETLHIINNWRSSHSYPLQVIKMNLTGKARSVDSKAVVAQRLKRLASIELKLRRFTTMDLSYMQDLGGCRAVVKNVNDVEGVHRLYRASRSKNPTGRHEFVREKDYILEPKEDGYRSLHLVYKYQSRSPLHAVHNGRSVEIQVRSSLQHAWATAVETVGTFLRQALKSNQGEESWLRFFALMGSALARLEKRPLIPGTPTNKRELVLELRELAKILDVQARLQTYGETIQASSTPSLFSVDSHYYLLVQNPGHATVVFGFPIEQLQQATERYLDTERSLAGVSGAEVVLVSVEKMVAIKKAYPNYFLDTKLFLQLLKETIAK